MIFDNIKDQITAAMKAGDKLRMETLKMLSAELTNAEIEKKREKLTGEEEVAVVKREAKKRREAIEIYEKAGERQRVEREQKELEVLEEFLPEEMSDSELEKIVDEVIAGAGQQEVGRVIGAVMGKVKGLADGKRVAELVRKKIG